VDYRGLYSCSFFHESFEQLFRPDDHETWVRSFVVILLIAFGTYAQRIVNARERAEESTRHAHAELDQISQTGADGMCVVDKGFNVLRANKALFDFALSHIEVYAS
jgi:PAS domain-containing protein